MAQTTNSSGETVEIGPGTSHLGISDTYTYLDGEKFIGEWKGGLPWNGTREDKDGNAIATWTNGIWSAG
jgi:hypothetical protein